MVGRPVGSRTRTWPSGSRSPRRRPGRTWAAAVRAHRHAPGAFTTPVKAVADLKVRGAALAVASSSARERLDRTLARGGLRVRRQRWPGTRSSTASRSPTCSCSPRERLGIGPPRCVVVEDSPPGSPPVAPRPCPRSPSAARRDRNDLAGSRRSRPTKSRAEDILRLLSRESRKLSVRDGIFSQPKVGRNDDFLLRGRRLVLQIRSRHGRGRHALSTGLGRT